MKPEKFFMDNLNRLPRGIDGEPQDTEKRNTYWGLVLLSREVEALRQEQQQVMHALRQIASRIQ